MTSHELVTLLETYVEPFTVMLAITTGEGAQATDVISNATGSLVYTGRKEILVTNHHVYAEFSQRRQEAPNTKLIMSGAHGHRFLDISEAEVLSRDQTSDLAVLHIPKQHVLRQGKLFSVFPSWPPRRPEPGMLAVVYGYPGQGRMPQGQILGVSALSITLPIASVSDRHFVLVDENDSMEAFTPDGQQPLTSFGGISGSAVYVISKKTAAADDELLLGGFVYEASDSGIICVSHADYISPDGSVR